MIPVPQKSSQNGTERRKARQIYGSVEAYFFVNETAMYVHKSLTLCIDIYLCHPASTYDGHPKFQNETISRRARQFWQSDGKIHLFARAYCIHAYHTYAYMLSHGLPAK